MRVPLLGVWIGLEILSLPIPVLAQSIDLTLADQYFQEAQAICQRDQGQLWGVSLCGPMLFADPGSRMAVANQADQAGSLTPKGEVYIGRLPNQLNIANMSTIWSGVQWTMIMWPLPEDRKTRAQLIVHELWHRIQEDIGLPASNPSNDHLDTPGGRIWLQLEWRALERALMHEGPERRRAVQDALVFRAYRRQLFPKASSDERALEMNEGLAQYTGLKLASGSRQEFLASAVRGIREANGRKSFIRSFAYVSGPAYGILLDEAMVNWRQKLRPEDDLGVFLARSLFIKMPEDLQGMAEQRGKYYDGDALRRAETERENEHQKLLAQYRVRLVEGPVLIIPFRKVNVQFDPNALVPLDGLGTIYPTIRATDVWGILTVSQGALLDPHWTGIRISAPLDSRARPLKGDGWTLELNEGWTIKPAARQGDYVLENLAPPR